MPYLYRGYINVYLLLLLFINTINTTQYHTTVVVLVLIIIINSKYFGISCIIYYIYNIIYWYLMVSHACITTDTGTYFVVYKLL